MKTQDIKNMAAAIQQVAENQKAAMQKKLAKSAAPSEKGKAAVTLPKAPWDKKNEAMDPVDHKELKGKHKDRKDKDIDNDGDVDKSDEYLHNRRKAVSKAMKKKGDEEVVMNPKKEKKGKDAEMTESVDKARSAVQDHDMDADHVSSHGSQHVFQGTQPDRGTHMYHVHDTSTNKTHHVELDHGGKTMSHGSVSKAAGKNVSSAAAKAIHSHHKSEMSESTDWPIYKKIMENRAAHYKGAAPADPKDIGQSPGGKKMKADLEAGSKVDDTDVKAGPEDAKKAGGMTKTAPGRNGDNKKGDKTIINPPEDITKKGGMAA